MSTEEFKLGLIRSEKSTTSLRWRYSRARPNDPPVLEQLFRITQYDHMGAHPRHSEEWRPLPEFVDD